MSSTLIRLAQIEGQATNYQDLLNLLKEKDLLNSAIEIGYFDGMCLVVDGYKLAATERNVEAGVNTNEWSVSLFRSTGEALSALALDETRPLVTRALLIHNDASCQAPWNGNFMQEQNALNQKALTLLLTASLDERDEDWQFVRAKCAVGLYESGEVDFDEEAFLQIIDFKRRHKAKDFAGRVKFYAWWLNEYERTEEAIAFLTEQLDGDDFSAPNQLQAAKALLQELQGS